jgi:hypothetical protein
MTSLPKTLKPLTNVEFARFAAWVEELSREHQQVARWALDRLIEVCRIAGADVDLRAVEKMTEGLRRSRPRRPIAVPVEIQPTPEALARRRAKRRAFYEQARREAEQRPAITFYEPTRV